MSKNAFSPKLSRCQRVGTKIYTEIFNVTSICITFSFFHFVDGTTKVKVIAGESLGSKAVIDTRTPIMFLDIHVQAGGTFVQDVPEEYNGFVYVWRGAGSFTEERISVEMGMVTLNLQHNKIK